MINILDLQNLPSNAAPDGCHICISLISSSIGGGKGKG